MVTVQEPFAGMLPLLSEIEVAVLLTVPGPVAKVCVDLSDYDVNKIVHRGAPTVVGMVESAESFLRELARSLGAW